MPTMNCTNIVKAFVEVGIKTVMLNQLKAPYIQYDGDNVSTECVDSEGVGYLSYCLDNDISLMGFCR